MIAPLEKYLAGGNDIIQIVVTRKCDIYDCSNCTQLLPFRQDDYEMTPEVFERAVESLEGWPGVIAMFGGNPCTHSRFAILCEILERLVPDQRQRGLWTNNLRQHGAVVRRVFWPHGRFNLNAHHSAVAEAEFRHWLPGIPVCGTGSGAIMHAAVLADRRDWQLPDEEWIRLRENCDINRKWSAAIYQRKDEHGKPAPYAYFCEVAGAIDGVRGENHGIPAEKGWWQKNMSAFTEQVNCCCDRGCGIPLRLKGHEDTDAIYDVSPSLVPLLIRGKKRVEILAHEKMPMRTHEVTDYLGRRKPCI